MQELIALLDGIKLPVEIPLLLHPAVVHFAIALPVVALLLEVSNIFIKRKCVGVISSMLLFLAAIVYIAAFFTGKTDGSEAYSLLSSEGKEELKEHKILGIYLVYGIGAIFVLKLIFAAISSRVAKLIFTILLAVFVGFALKQGKDGGELVYKYGANVKALSSMDDKVMELEDALDSCKEKLKKHQNTPAQQPQTNQSNEATPNTSTQSTEQTASSSTETKESSSTTSQAVESNESQEITIPTTIQEKAKAALEQIKGKAEEAVETLKSSAEQVKHETSMPQTPAQTQENLEQTHE